MTLISVSFLGLPNNDWWWYIATSAWLNVVIWDVTFAKVGAFCVALDAVAIIYHFLQWLVAAAYWVPRCWNSQKDVLSLGGVGGGLFLWFTLLIKVNLTVCVIGTYHRPLIVLLLPFVIILPLYRTSTYFNAPFVKKWSCIWHYIVVARSITLIFISGIACVFLTTSGNPSTPSPQLCVLLVFSPFATVTTIGFAITFFVSSGVLTCRKCKCLSN